MSVDGFVMAGGQSRRMGRNKALLELDGRPLIARVATALAGAADRVVVVANDAESVRFLGLEVAPDRWPGAAALGGIGTALSLARTERALVAACDLPFVTTALFQFLIAVDPAADVVLPVTEADGRHPLCAVYSRRCLPHIEARIAASELKVAGFFAAVTVREVSEPELRAAGFSPDLLRNLNTEQEYRAAGGRG